MSEEKYFLIQVGSNSSSNPALDKQVLLQPMFGTEEQLVNCGDSFWVPEALMLAMTSCDVEIPPNGSLPRRPVETGVTCPSRMRGGGPWEIREGLDTWDKIGPDRCCDFCGSIHPEDLNKLLEDDTIGVVIHRSDKKYKFYIHRDGVINAGMGAIKWYTWHDDIDVDLSSLLKAYIDKKLSEA